MHFDESQKLQQMQEFWKHKQLEMLEEEHRLTVENEVTHTSVYWSSLNILLATDAVSNFESFLDFCSLTTCLFIRKEKRS